MGRRRRHQRRSRPITFYSPDHPRLHSRANLVVGADLAREAGARVHRHLSIPTTVCYRLRGLDEVNGKTPSLAITLTTPRSSTATPVPRLAGRFIQCRRQNYFWFTSPLLSGSGIKGHCVAATAAAPILSHQVDSSLNCWRRFRYLRRWRPCAPGQRRRR